MTIPPRLNDGRLRFVWSTDNHWHANNGQQQAESLAAAVADCNNWQPDLFINTGDFGDNTLATVQAAFAITSQCLRPVHVAIGNHDEWEDPIGTAQTSAITGPDCFNRPAPFYYSEEYNNALLCFLDCNFYGDIPDQYHNVGDRVGYYAGANFGLQKRQLGATQLQWLSDTMAGSDADYVLVFLHYPQRQIADSAALLSALAADGRPVTAFYGHDHNKAQKFTHSGIPFYKCPALLESHSWTRVTVSEAGAVEHLIIRNFTDPNAGQENTWTIDNAYRIINESAPLALAV